MMLKREEKHIKFKGKVISHAKEKKKHQDKEMKTLKFHN